MKKKVFRRVVSVALALCMIFTMIPMSVMSTAAAQTQISKVEGVWGNGAKNFGVNKIYSIGLVACGTILKNIASMTGNEDFQKVASFLNVWVFSGNPTTDILNSISQMCSQILSEVTEINEKLDVYSADIMRQISESQFTALEKNQNEAWQRDVVDVMNRYNIKNAFETFFNFEALDTSISTTENDMSYLVAAIYCQTGQKDKNGKTYTQDDVKAYQEKLFTKFCEIHGAVDDKLSKEGKEQALFETMPASGNSMDAIMLNAINELSGNLTRLNDDSYADACAQTAMQGLVSLADQKDYILSNLNKQILVITLTEMMYQEYLSMRAEYLEKNYDEGHEMWTDYYNDVYGKEGSKDDSFKSINETIKSDVENRLTVPLKFSSNVYLAIGQLPSTADLQGVVLDNTQFSTTFNSYDKEQPIIDYDGGYYYDDISSNASVTSKHMAFEKLPVYTSRGVEMYYILVDEEFNKNNGTPKLVHGEFYLGNDDFLPSCDYFNLVRGTYTDGVNNFASPSMPKEEAALFSTNNYSLSDSQPVKYLYDYYKDYSDKALYQIFPTYEYTQNGAFRDPHANFAVLDMTAKSPSLNLSFKEQTKISAQDTYEGYAPFSNGYYYTVILKNKSTSTSFKGYTTPTLLENKLSFSTTGPHTADIKVDIKVEDSKNTNYYPVSNGSNVACGEPLTLKFKAVDDITEFASLKLLRYNDTQNPTVATSEQVILNADDFETLTQKDGYYILDANMPYSNAEFVLETKNKVNADERENFIIKTYDDLLTMSEKVNSGDEDFVNGNFLLENDIVVPDGAQWTAPIGTSSSKFKGTFDGQGYTISGLNSEIGGLFGIIEDATIKNINLKNLNISAYERNCGGLCEQANGNSLISNCSVDGSISVRTTAINSEPAYVSGICAQLESGTIEKCINKATINADAYNVSGICGTNSGKIKDCANFGNIKCFEVNIYYDERMGANISGVAVYNYGTVENCYNVAEVTQEINNMTPRKSSIVTSGTAPVNCYYLNTCTSDSNATSKTIEQFKSGEVTYLLNNGITDGTQVWYQNVDYKEPYDEYPHFNKADNNTVYTDDISYTNTKPVTIEKNEDGVFVIETYEQLCLIAEKVNAGIEEYVNGSYILANDITVPENEYWNTPIGTPSAKFSGTFDGQGHKIIGLKSNKPALYNPDSIVDNTNMGLFGWIRNAEIKNIHLENVNFSLDDTYRVAYVGALCARAENDNTISKCTVSGSMTFSDASYVGGLVGTAIAGKNNITNCANHIDFTITSGSACGGIAGSCDSGVTISNCYTVGDINGSFRNCNVINGSGGKVNNSYVLNNTNYMVYSGTTECTAEQFKSGEVAYLLNKNVAIPSWAWFQNLDNGKTPDEFPTLNFTRDNVVFKVDREDKTYSNIPNDYLIGDADLDGKVTVMDATIIQMHCAKLYELTGVSLVNADTTRDNIISISDATKVQGYIAGIIKEL